MTGALHMLGDGDHGTGVAGIIAAEHNGTGIDGVMKDNIEIVNISYKWASEHSLAIARAIQYAVDVNVDVINMSLWARDTKEMRTAIKNASDKNIIVVCSAGNMAQLDTNHYPSKYTREFNNVISVASSSRDSLLSSFSNFGNKYVDVIAPGKNIYQPYGENGFHISSGTSFAAPIVSGIVGLVLESHGKAAAKTMKQRLINSSRKLQSLSGKVSSNGLINAYNAMTGQTSLNLLWQ
jgi:major intracellular serine protease